MLSVETPHCGEGAGSRWSAKHSQPVVRGASGMPRSPGVGAASQPSGSKRPRHKKRVPEEGDVYEVEP